MFSELCVVVCLAKFLLIKMKSLYQCLGFIVYEEVCQVLCIARANILSLCDVLF